MPPSNLVSVMHISCFSATAAGSGKRQLVRTGTCTAALSQKANGYNAPANNKSFEKLVDDLCMYFVFLFSRRELLGAVLNLCAELCEVEMLTG